MRGPRDERDRYQPPSHAMRSHDDFFVRPQRGQRGGRRQGLGGPTPDMYAGGHHGGPPGYNNYGPPPRHYNHDPYREPYHPYAPHDNYGPGPGGMMYGGPPPRGPYQGGPGPYNRDGGRDGMRQPPSGGPPGGNQYHRDHQRPGGDKEWDRDHDYDQRMGDR